MSRTIGFLMSFLDSAAEKENANEILEYSLARR